MSDTNPLVYEGDKSTDRYSIWWIYRHETTNEEIAIKNPRMEPDVDDDGHHYHSPAWDEMTVNGEPATDDQEDEFSDDLRECLRQTDWD